MICSPAHGVNEEFEFDSETIPPTPVMDDIDIRRSDHEGNTFRCFAIHTIA